MPSIEKYIATYGARLVLEQGRVNWHNQRQMIRAWLIFMLSCCAFAPRGWSAPATQPPNIIYILADDLGWKDVGYHGSEIKTPHLDQLAASGVKLEQFYVMPLCSPTRASLMTGRYPIRYGLQTGVVRPWANYGLPLEERTLAQALKEAGYATSICGKWHLGHFEPAYQPTHRGFDQQYGHYNGIIDYWTHERDGGHDWHRNDQASHDEGYSTMLIGHEAAREIYEHNTAKPLFLYVAFNAPHEPLQAPQEYLERYPDIQDPKRRAYAAMVTCLDNMVAEILGSLDAKGIRDNTLILFSSDNGGPLKFGANNGSLRDGKGTVYEGGVRVPAFAVWPGKLPAGTTNNAPLHMVDWYPTLLKLAGASLEQKLPLDGRDIWPTLTEGKPSPHEDILINVEASGGALRRGDWKLVMKGQLGGAIQVELFNLAEDPEERNNRSGRDHAVMVELLPILSTYAQAAVPAKDQPVKPEGFKSPAVWGEATK